jgi:hypothetical protein
VLPRRDRNNGTTRRNPRCCEYPGDDWNSLLVRPIIASDLAQLPDQKHRRATSIHDVDMVNFRRAVWRLRHCAEIQHPSHYPAAVLLCLVRCELGAVSHIWTVCRVMNDFRSVMLMLCRQWRTWTATLLLLGLLVVFAGVEIGLILAIQPAYARGVDWPVLTIGIIAFVTLLSGYLPIPFELLKRRGRVVGIDFIFLSVDWCGAFFSLMALVAQTEFDALFGTMYAMW